MRVVGSCSETCLNDCNKKMQREEVKSSDIYIDSVKTREIKRPNKTFRKIMSGRFVSDWTKT